MSLGEIIAALEAADPRLVLPDGFTNPHSYRGYYEQLAFEPAENVTVASMLATAKSALGKTFHGDYEMEDFTACWIAEYGCLGEMIGPRLIGYMIAAGHAPPAGNDKAAILAELFDQAHDGDIEGTVIRHDGHEVWIHTTGQVTAWLHTLMEQAREAKPEADQ